MDKNIKTIFCQDPGMRENAGHVDQFGVREKHL